MNTILLVALLAQQPWSTDLAKVQADASEKKAPLVVLVNVDAPSMELQSRENDFNAPPAHKSIEYKLSSCEQLIKLSRTNLIAGLRMADRGAAALPSDARVLMPESFFVVVLDPAGELLGCMQPELTGSNIVAALQKMSAWLPGALKRAESFEQLRRLFEKGTKDDYVPAFLLERFQEMGLQHEFTKLATPVVANEALAPEMRNLADVYDVWSKAGDGGVIQSRSADRIAVLDQAERVLLHSARHRLAASIARSIVTRVFMMVFDLPAKTAECARRLTLKSQKSPDAAAVQAAIRAMNAELAEWKKRMNSMKAMGPTQAAQIGDAKATIKAFDNPESLKVEMYREWVDEAKAKLSGKKP